jgi:DNA-binding CsgD family transcriptional regulator
MDRTDSAPASAQFLSLTLWHPGCGVIDVSERVSVGLLGYGIYPRDDGRATTLYRLYGDDRATVEEGLARIREHPDVYGASPMVDGYRRPGAPTPGNASRELLVEHDATTQISDAFTSRGFTYAAPCDTYGGRERWELFVTADRDDVQRRLDEIRSAEDAEIDVESITPAARANPTDPLPADRLSHRQREVFQLSRRRGYYRRPKAATASELAAELGITTSTFHEHLHRAEEKLLALSADASRPGQ